MFACTYYVQQCKCYNIWVLAVIMLKNNSDNYLPYQRESAGATPDDRTPPSVCNFRAWDANASVGVVDHVWRHARYLRVQHGHWQIVTKSHGNLNARTGLRYACQSHKKKIVFLTAFCLKIRTLVRSFVYDFEWKIAKRKPLVLQWRVMTSPQTRAQ